MAAAAVVATAGDVCTSTRLEVTQAAVPQVVRRIRQRWQTRLQLSEQIRRLAATDSGGAPQNGGGGTSATVLVRWQPIGWPEYSEQTARRFISGGGVGDVVDENDLFYAVTVTCGGGGGGAPQQQQRFECAVRVSVQHPRVLPLWAKCSEMPLSAKCSAGALLPTASLPHPADSPH